MEIISQFFAGAMLVVTGLIGFGGTGATPSSVELGLYEVSPRGEEGGFAIPASGCSPASPSWHGYPIHDCEILPNIDVDKPVIRYGESVIVDWDPNSHRNCVLSESVTTLPPSEPNGNIPGSRVDTPTGEVTYSITCEGVGNEDFATVKVLPRFQET